MRPQHLCRRSVEAAGDALGKRKAWLIYQWQRYIRAGTVLRPRALPCLRALQSRPTDRQTDRQTSASNLSVVDSDAVSKPEGDTSGPLQQQQGVIRRKRAQKQDKQTDRQAVRGSIVSRRCVGGRGSKSKGEHFISLRRAFIVPASRCCEHPCRPHGAPGSRHALQAGAKSMPALQHLLHHPPPCTPLPTPPLMCPPAMPPATPASPLVSPCPRHAVRVQKACTV